MQPVTITKAVLKDWMEIRALEQACFTPIDVFKPTQIRRLLTSKTSLPFIIRMNGKIVASIIGLLRNFRIPSGRIYKVAVHRDSRGLGLASRLLQFVEKKLRGLGAKKCCAEVRLSNTGSQHAFEKNGYVKSGALPRYYADGEDGVKFWKTL